MATSRTQPIDAWQMVYPRIGGFMVSRPDWPIYERQTVALLTIYLILFAQNYPWSMQSSFSWMPRIDSCYKRERREQPTPRGPQTGTKTFCWDTKLYLNQLLVLYMLLILGCWVKAIEKALIKMLRRVIFCFLALLASTIGSTSVTSKTYSRNRCGIVALQVAIFCFYFQASVICTLVDQVTIGILVQGMILALMGCAFLFQMNQMISPFNTLPFLPVPITQLRSILCSLAHILTVDDANISFISAEGCWIGCIVGASTFYGFLGEGDSVLSPLVQIQRKISPTWQVSSSWQNIFLMIPSSGELIQVNCLSDYTSAIFQNSVTASPYLTYNFLTLPSLIFSPRSGRGNLKIPKGATNLELKERRGLAKLTIFIMIIKQKSIKIIDPHNSPGVLIANKCFGGEIDGSCSHFPVVLRLHLKQFFGGFSFVFLFFGEIVFEELAIILEEEDIGGVAILKSEVDGLVGLVVFDVVDGHELLGLAPVPEGEGAVHVIGENVFAVEGGFGDAVLQTSDPLLSADADGLPREEILLAVLEELNVVDWRGYEVDIYRLAHPHVVLDNRVGD